MQDSNNNNNLLSEEVYPTKHIYNIWMHIPRIGSKFFYQVRLETAMHDTI